MSDLTDAEWERLCPLLPSSAGKRGQPWGDHRRIINGILWRTWNGATWRAVPGEYGPWKTCYYRFSLWDEDGTWGKILNTLQRQADAEGDRDWDAQVDATIVRAPSTRPEPERGLDPEQSRRQQALEKSRGGLSTKNHTAAEGRGRVLAERLTPGQDAEVAALVPLIDDIAVPRPGGTGRPRNRPDSVKADMAYASKANRKALRDRKIKATIPEKGKVAQARRKRGSRGGRPPKFNAEAYKERNHVERGFGPRKQWCAVATRYGKLGSRYAATCTIAAIMDWTRARPDQKSPDTT